MFGSLADFDDLLAEVHRRGMKLVLDLVVNHTSDEHPWFQQSRRGPGAAKRDWYWWRGPRPGMAPGAAGAVGAPGRRRRADPRVSVPSGVAPLPSVSAAASGAPRTRLPVSEAYTS